MHCYAQLCLQVAFVVAMYNSKLFLWLHLATMCAIYLNRLMISSQQTLFLVHCKHL